MTCLIDRVLTVLRDWADHTGAKSSVSDFYVFGSLIYRGGDHFDQTSDVDVLAVLSEESFSTPLRVAATQSLVTPKVELEITLLRELARSDASKPVASIVVASPDDIRFGIHKDGKRDFFGQSEFLPLTTAAKTATTLPAEVLYDDADAPLVQAIQAAQKIRNQFLASSANSTNTTLREWDGKEPLPKDLRRSAAQVRFAELALDDKSKFDLNEGLEYLHEVVRALPAAELPFQDLREWLTKRRGGRGVPSPMSREIALVLWEVLAERAYACLRARKGSLVRSAVSTRPDRVEDVGGNAGMHTAGHQVCDSAATFCATSQSPSASGDGAAVRHEERRTFVIIMDEKGSTEKDRSSTDAQLLARRERLFGLTVGRLIKHTSVRIIKTVGDALIVRCEENDVPALIEALVEHVEALRTMEGGQVTGIRMAVHGRDRCAGFSDSVQVDAFLSRLMTHAKSLDPSIDRDRLLTAWPGVKEALRDDLFGPTINLTARLAGIPTEPYLVVSEQVASLVSSGTLERSPHGTPLFALKGAQAYTCRQPWMVFQVRRVVNPGGPPADPPIFDLEIEASAFQAWREIYVKTHATDDNIVDVAKQTIAESIRHAEGAVSTCVDLLFAVLRCWQMSPFPTNRADKSWVASEECPLKDQAAEKNGPEAHLVMPVHMVLTSCLDQAHDSALREEIAGLKDPVGDSWDAMIETNYIFGRASWLREGIGSSGLFALVRFLVAQEFIHQADKKDQLFARLANHLNGKWECRSFGLLRGSLDAFVLYQYASADKHDRNLLGNDFVRSLWSEVRRAHTGTWQYDKTPTFKRLIPVSVDLLELDVGAGTSARQRKLRVLRETEGL